MQTSERTILVVGTRQDICDKLAGELGLRQGVDEIKYHHWYNPNSITHSAKSDREPDVIVTEARPSGAINAFRIYVRDLMIAHPKAKIVVIAPGMGDGRFNAHAVVHTALIADLAATVKPLLPSETVDA
jgi:hypothetical protein